MVKTEPSPHIAARKALATRLQNISAADGELEKSRRHLESLGPKQREAQKAVDAARVLVDRVSTLGIQSLAHGGPAPEITLQETRKELTDAEDHLATVVAARALAKSLHQKFSAEYSGIEGNHALKQAVRDVVSTDPNVLVLCERFAAARTEYARLGSVMALLSSFGGLPEKFEDLMMWEIEWPEEVREPWEKALTQLTTDPDTPLPTHEAT